MRRHENFNTKGVSNVRSESGSTNADDWDFDSSKADVIRDESRWDAFQLVGDTNQEEIDHKAVLKHQKSANESKRDSERIRSFWSHNGKKILRQAQMA